MTDSTASPVVSALSVSVVTGAAMTIASPFVVAYAKKHGVDLSTPEQIQAVNVFVGVGFGAATAVISRIGGSLVDAVVAINGALSNRAMQALNKVGGVAATAKPVPSGATS